MIGAFVSGITDVKCDDREEEELSRAMLLFGSSQRIPQDVKLGLEDEELDTDEKCTICLSILEDQEDVR